MGKDSEGKEMSLMDRVSTGEEDVFREVETKLKVKELYDKVSSALTTRERKIIQLRYGLGGGRVLTQRQIAGRMGISRSYVSRIEKKALEKLSAAMTPADDVLA